MAIDKALEQRIDEYLKQNREHIVSDLCELVRVPSIQSAPVPGKPFGEACYNAVNKAVEIFSRYGYRAENCDGKYGLAYYGEGEKTVGLFGHSDVVPVGEGWIYTEPFEPIEKDGILIGRGISDNKSGVIGSLWYLNLVSDLGIKLKNKVTCYIGSAEETGMADMDYYIKEQKAPDFSLVPDGSFPFGYGEKGICRFWETAPEGFEAVTEFSGGSAFNVVLDKVNVSVKKTAELENEISAAINGRSDVTADFSGDEIKLVFKGITKHAASPEGSLNAAWIATDFLRTVKALPETDRKAFAYAAYILDGYYGENIGIDHHDSVFGKLTCVNGMAKIADGKLSISFDIRYGTEKDSAEMTKQIEKSLSDNGWDANICELGDGFLLDRTGNRIIDEIENIYREVSGNAEARGIVMSGGTYARKLPNAVSISMQAPYNKKTLPMPAGHGSAHQCDEMLSIDSYLEAIKIMALMAIRIDEMI